MDVVLASNAVITGGFGVPEGAGKQTLGCTENQ